MIRACAANLQNVARVAERGVEYARRVKAMILMALSIQIELTLLVPCGQNAKWNSARTVPTKRYNVK